MAKEFNPIPEIFGEDPDAGSGDFLDGLIFDRSKTFKPELEPSVGEMPNTITPSLQQKDNSIVPEDPNQ